MTSAIQSAPSARYIARGRVTRGTSSARRNPCQPSSTVKNATAASPTIATQSSFSGT